MPMLPPSNRQSSVDSGAMMSTVRAPASVRESTSWPTSSVPNQCAALGAASEWSGSTCSGEYLVR